MVEPLNDSNFHEYLTAFTDGELDAAQVLCVLDYLAVHPDAMEVLRGQQQLRLVADRVVRQRTPALPDALRQRIRAMAETVIAETANDSTASPPTASSPTASNSNGSASRGIPLSSPTSRPSPSRISPSWISPSHQSRRWLWPSAVAAMLLLGLSIGWLIPKPIRPDNGDGGIHPIPPAVAPTLVAAVTRVHVDCSRFEAQLHDGPFPTSTPILAALKPEVEKEFHREVPYPDLSSIGYAYVGAGPCREPLKNTVHLLYRSTKKNVIDTLSLFVQPYTGQINVPAGKVALVAGALSPHPMYVWHTDRAAYFLVSDDLDTADKARDVILVASRQ